MRNVNLLRGLFLMAIALVFGLSSLRYKLGDLGTAGPGLFPLIASTMLFVIALAIVVRSRFVAAEPIDYAYKNIAFVLLGLVGMTVISQYLNMTVGIVFLVFVSSFAAKSYSVRRSFLISLALIAFAFGFRDFLGLNLPLI